MFYNVVHTSATDSCTLESRIIGRVRIGRLDIVIVINNRGGGGEGVGIIGGIGLGWKNSVGGFLVLIC